MEAHLAPRLFPRLGAHGSDPLSPSDRANDLVGPALGAALEAKRREFDDRCAWV